MYGVVGPCRRTERDRGAGMNSEKLHETLWRTNLATAEACLAHPFLRGIADGSLPADTFKHYVGQDAFFLRAFFSAFALAAARSAEQEDVARLLHSLMKGVLDELELHKSYAAELGIDLERVSPDPATRAYTDFLLRTAWTSDAGEILAAMTPCMKLYLWLGRQLAGGDHSANPYRDWIDTYASDDFDDLAAELEAMLDRLAEPGELISSAYSYAMQCEYDFFAGAYERAVAS